MGMGSSQARLLTLTSRNSDITRNLQLCANQKEALTRDMNKVSKKYRDALNRKVLKYSNDGGAKLSDLSYRNLMQPSAVNGNSPILITNANGKVVLNNKYKEYAEMLDKAGGNWNNNETRAKILSSLTGIPAETIKKAKDAEFAEEELYVKMTNALEKCTSIVGLKDKNGMLARMGDFAGYNYEYYGNTSVKNGLLGDYNWCETDGFNWEGSQLKYRGSWVIGTDNVTAKQGLKDILNQIKANISNYLFDEDIPAFETACNDTYSTYEKLIDNAGNDPNISVVAITTYAPGYTNTHSHGPNKGEQYRLDNAYEMQLHYFIDDLLENYQKAGGRVDSNGRYIVTNRTSGNGGAKYRAYEELKAEYEKNVDINNQILTSPQRAEIEFYDKIFTAISECGWTYDSQADDDEYINQMFQNNQFYITTMTENNPDEKFDSNGEKISRWDEYYYNSDLWSDTQNIFAVNDEEIRQQALVEYEYEKGKINAKDSKIDKIMKNYETEQSAIQKMIQGIETVRNDNIETYFSIFS